MRVQASFLIDSLAFAFFVCAAIFILPISSTSAEEFEWSPDLAVIPAGEFISGSDRSERDLAYELDEAAYGHSVTRTQKWYESEYGQQTRTLPEYSIMKSPVTRCEYSRFLADTGHPSPQIDETTWNAQGLIHAYPSTIKFQWLEGEQNKLGRCQHPVVLVSHEDAKAFASWLSMKTGATWRLPNEFEWEKAARGVSGNIFPWGDQYDAAKLNSHDKGPFDTLPVAGFGNGASPFGLLDAAGQVFEWTSTNGTNDRRFVVKGGSWDDKGCGVCRPAARHSRDKNLKHILVGFRLVTD